MMSFSDVAKMRNALGASQFNRNRLANGHVGAFEQTKPVYFNFRLWLRLLKMLLY